MTLHFEEKLEPHTIFLLLLRGVNYYKNAWHDLDERCGMFGSTDPSTFNMRAVASSSPVIEYVIRPHLQTLCVLAGYVYRKETGLLEPHIPRAQLVSMLNKGVAWVCDTHLTGTRDVDTFLERKRWGENWRSSLWASLLGLVSCLAADVLEPGLVARVKEVLAHEANRFIGVSPPSGCDVDTKLEENAIDTLCMSWAINLCDDHPNQKLWERSCAIWSLNVATTFADKANHSAYLEKSVSHFVTTQTLFPDQTAENHGFFHPDILCYGMWVVLAMAAYSFNKREIPDCFRCKNHQETFDLLLRFCLPTGMHYAPSGNDLPYFLPRPFSLAWGLWNNDPRALSITGKLLSWMDSTLTAHEPHTGPWVFGFEQSHEGWELFFQSQVGFELTMLGVLPFPEEFRFYSSGQIENAIDTRQIYPYVDICYRRNVRMTRSVAWKALGDHPVVGLCVHSCPELIMQYKAAMLGIPQTRDHIRQWEVVFHNDRFQKDGFDTCGRIFYSNANGEKLLRRDVRMVTWGDDGLLIFDKITAEQDVSLEEQYLSPIHIVNDFWTNDKIDFASGSLREWFTPRLTDSRKSAVRLSGQA
jgi:hypothetical protein